MKSILLKVFLLKLLHVASALLSPPLLTLQLLMPTKMSSTAWVTSHAILNPTLVRLSVWISTLTAHNSTMCLFLPSNFPPICFCAVHRSELTNGKIKSVSSMLKVLKECPNPRKYFDPDKYLDALQLDSLLPRKEVDTSLYITNRAKLEQMYPYLIEGQIDAVPNVVYSTLKHLVSEEAEAGAVRDKCKLSPQLTCQSLHVYAFHSDTSIVSSHHHMHISEVHMCVCHAKFGPPKMPPPLEPKQQPN